MDRKRCGRRREPVYAQQDASESGTTEQSEPVSDSDAGSVKKLEDILVTGKSGMQGLDVKPTQTTIDVDDFVLHCELDPSVDMRYIAQSVW